DRVAIPPGRDLALEGGPAIAAELSREGELGAVRVTSRLPPPRAAPRRSRAWRRSWSMSGRSGNGATAPGLSPGLRSATSPVWRACSHGADYLLGGGLSPARGPGGALPRRLRACHAERLRTVNGTRILTPLRQAKIDPPAGVVRSRSVVGGHPPKVAV